MSGQIMFEESPDLGENGFTSDKFHVATSCRACLGNEYSLIKTTSSDHDLVKFSDKLMACIPEVMWLKEGLPSLICSNCIESLRVAYEFRNVCLQSDQTFTRYISQMRSENELGRVQVRSTSPLEVDTKFECTTTQVIPDTLPFIKEEPPHSPQIYFLDTHCLEQSEHFTKASELMYSCRACLITKHSLMKTTCLDHDLIKFSDKLTACIPEVMWLKEGLPSLICSNCVESLRVAYEFRNVCLQSDQTLMKYISQMRGENEPERVLVRSASPKLDAKFECTSTQVVSDTSPYIKEESPNSPQIHFLVDDHCLERSEHLIETSEPRNSTPEPEKYVNFISQKQLESVTGINNLPHNIEEPGTTEVTQRNQLDQQLLIHPQNEPQVQHELQIQEQPSQQNHVTKQTTDVQVHPCLLEHRLEVHMPTHTGEKPFECKYCKKRFLSSSNLELHIKVHVVKKQFQCAGGDQKFRMRTHTGEKPYSCTTCGKKYSTSGNLKMHIRTHTGERVFSCTVCGYRSLSASHLKEHMMTHTGEKPYSCTTCGKKFSRSSNLNAHIRTHTSEKLFSCTLCDYRSLTAEHLKRHMRTHTGEKPYSCTICEKKFSSSGNLKTHIRTHIGEKRFSCTLCDYRSLTARVLKQHMRSHRSEKPYSCNTCGKKFITSATLKRHIRTHTGEKPFSCTVCDYTCSISSNLKQHLRTHTGEKPYSCTTCGKKFAFSGVLKKHIRTHTGEKGFPCTVCDYRCSTSFNLKKHIQRKHTAEKTHICCTTCGKKFAGSRSFKLHMRSHT